jgi:glutamate carboxypeptidase
MGPVRPLASIRQAVDDDLDATAETILDWSSINSGSANIAGVAEVQRRLAARLDSIGFDTEMVAVAPTEVVDHDGTPRAVPCGPVLRASARSACHRRLLVVGHADTVFAPDHPFQSPWREGERLRGPGVADMKGGLVAMGLALGAILERDLAPGLGVDVVVVGDEEVGSVASAPVLAAATRRAEAALVLEPALPDGSLARARPGSGNVTFVVNGRAAHAGRALREGRNAVVAAAALAAEAHRLTDQRPGLGVNVAAVHGGAAFNAVPDRCTLRLNLRAPDPADLDWALDQLDVHAGEVAAGQGVAVERHGGIHRPAKPWTPAAQRLADVVADVGAEVDLPVTWADTGGVCDGNNLAATGLAVIDTVGVRGGAIHTAEEYCDLASLGAVVALLAGVADRLAGHEPLRAVPAR